ncbi:diaminobutyrate--2-oxoglutarate transaminase [Chitinolyticbacter meiyuanensis]|uniref:diaminobutyrate--2-oxoglutarate transaminase n=1 Tax=Chitinolyticbacter meiyuanensis TaxID=682798 RepID=UPI0011E5A2FB|nr:diaminobutyrate--2-oxoglutarate transaminase [Chitinolyticbacter meiyuanensis]
MEIFKRLESEVRGYIRAFPTIFTTARGAQMTDESGRHYLDFFAGAGTLNYGHNHPDLKAAAIEYLTHDGLVHGLDMASTAKAAFLQAFDECILEPRGLRYKLQFTGPTGTNAMEAAIKLARNVTGRTRIVAFTHGFHGMTQGALACTANNKFREAGGVPPGSHVTFMPFDGYLGSGIDTAKLLRQMIEDPSSGLDMPAAVLLETVQGEGGVNVASSEWLQAIAKLCREHDILLVVDDIQAGCGRTGSFFSFERAGIVPDIITLSKSLSGLGLPMALVLLKPELDIWKPSQHNGTFRGNNLAFVTATAALNTFWRDRRFQQAIEAKARLVSSRLEPLVREFPQKLSRRGVGLMQGLVFQDPRQAAQVAQAAFDEGLIIEGCGAFDEVLKLLPPLTIPLEELEQGLKLLETLTRRVLEPIKEEVSA